MYRYTFHYSIYQQGFSETLFRATELGPTENILLDNYLQKRLNLMSTDVHLLSVRSSNVNSLRDIRVLSDPTILRTGTWAYGGSGTSGDPGSPTQPEDVFTALSVRLSDGGANFRSFALLGMPDYVFQANIIDPAERPIVTGRLNAWITAMTAAGFGMKAQAVPTVSGRIVEFPDKTADNQLVCLGLKGTIPAVGTLVSLGSVKPWTKLNKLWRVASTAPAAAGVDGYIYLAKSKDLNTYGPVEGGTYKQPLYSVVTLNQYTIARLTSRKTGVPFDTVRGRR